MNESELEWSTVEKSSMIFGEFGETSIGFSDKKQDFLSCFAYRLLP